ncbi:nitroreductase family protein [Enterocloster clostridioformis]
MISAIYNSQSIRKFIDKPISQEDIIDNGMKAPSSKNRPPWNYTVVNSWEKGLSW